jgi:hypothetical protein
MYRYYSFIKQEDKKFRPDSAYTCSIKAVIIDGKCREYWRVIKARLKDWDWQFGVYDGIINFTSYKVCAICFYYDPDYS